MTEPFQLDRNKSALHIKEWQGIDIVVGFTTRNGGVSEKQFSTLNMGYHVDDKKGNVDENYHRIEKIVNLKKNRWVSAKQVHQTSILEIDQTFMQKGFKMPPNFDIEYDGFITNEPNVLLTAVFADCVPLYFYAKKHKWIGLAHAGWKGTVNGIGKKMVESFLKKGIIHEDIKVAFGPSISGINYEVDDFVMNNIPNRFHKNPIVTKKDSNHYLLDLKLLNKEILLEQGIKESQILITNYCTFKDEDLFFSHRRDQGSTGRMMAFIGILMGKEGI